MGLDATVFEFERDMGCTEAEWLGWLPTALGPQPWQCQGARAQVVLEVGHLSLAWQVAPPRVIALLRIPRLLVHFRFVGVPCELRQAFLRRFDLHMHRGGG